VIDTLAEFTRNQFIGKVEHYRERAERLLTQIQPLCEKQLAPNTYEPVKTWFDPDRLIGVVIQVLIMERELLQAIVTSTSDLIGDLKGIIWNKAAVVFGLGENDNKESSFWSKVTDFFASRYIALESELEADADALARWNRLQLLESILNVEAKTIPLKRTHLMTVVYRADRFYMGYLHQAVKDLVSAYDYDSKQIGEWIASGRLVLDDQVEELRLWLRQTEAVWPQFLSGSTTLMLPGHPVQRPALNAPKNRINDYAGDTKNQQLTVHIDNAKAPFEIKNRKTNAVRADDHLHSDGKD